MGVFVYIYVSSSTRDTFKSRGNGIYEYLYAYINSNATDKFNRVYIYAYTYVHQSNARGAFKRRLFNVSLNFDWFVYV